MTTGFPHSADVLQYRWALWKLNDDGNEVRVCSGKPLCFAQLREARVFSTTLAAQVVIAGAGNKDSPLSELLDSLPANDCRYGGKYFFTAEVFGLVFERV